MTEWYIVKPQLLDPPANAEPSLADVLMKYYQFHDVPADKAPEYVAAYLNKIAEVLPTLNNYQSIIGGWGSAVFGENTDKAQRIFRFLEEALELVQSLNCSKEDALKLVDYVYDRPIGEPLQEVGCTMVTLAMLCNYAGLNLQKGAFDELQRIHQPEVIEKILAKNATKPRFSPLPGTADKVEEKKPVRTRRKK